MKKIILPVLFVLAVFLNVKYTYAQVTSIKSAVSDYLGSSWDRNADGKVNLLDIAALFVSTSATPTPGPTSPPTSPSEWTQFGHDAQRTSYTSQTVATPWRYKWQWNGADGNGKPQSGHLSVPALVQPITGSSKVYIIANSTVYALNPDNGSVVWSNGNLGTLSATPAYDGGYLYIPSGNNNLYKLNVTNGSVVSQYTAASSLNFAALITSGKVYVVSTGGILYAVNANDMSLAWQYNAGSPGVTSAAYSSSRNLILFLTQDLYIHAVNANGTLRWQVKPTVRNYSTADTTTNFTEAINGWPVVAEQHGLVFVRYRLEWNTLWAWSPYPNTNSAIRANLQSQPNQQVIFAIKLDDGSSAFIPAVGNGGSGDGGNLPMGPQPVVRVVDGKEVVYIIWRNGLTCTNVSYCDGREDAVLGEMVLDNTSVSGYEAGDVRFIGSGVYNEGQTDIQTDEMMQLTMSGDNIFHNHWLLMQNNLITNREGSVGATFLNPIRTSPASDVLWRQASGHGCTFDSVTRYCANGLFSYNDTRSYSAGFYEYFDSSQGGSRASTIVSNNLVLVKTGDGAIIALEYVNPTAGATTIEPFAQKLGISQAQVLGQATQIPVIDYTQALNYQNQTVIAGGTIKSAVNHLPKAIYLGFTDPHDGALLVRIFNKDLSKFPYDPMTLKDKKVAIIGKVTLYWPENVDPEIIVTDPSQIKILSD